LKNPFIDTRAELKLTSYALWWSTLDRKTKNMIRKSQRVGVIVQQVTPDEAFWEGVAGIYNEAPTKRGIKNTHYGDTPERVKEIYDKYGGPDRNIYLGAYWMGKLIGFAHLLRDEGCWHVSALQGYEDYFDKAPMDALVDAAVQLLCANDVKRLIYGRMQRSSLGEFKRSLGFHEVRVLRSVGDTVKLVASKVIQ
jgi:hypothetical protein